MLPYRIESTSFAISLNLPDEMKEQIFYQRHFGPQTNLVGHTEILNDHRLLDVQKLSFQIENRTRICIKITHSGSARGHAVSKYKIESDFTGGMIFTRVENENRTVWTINFTNLDVFMVSKKIFEKLMFHHQDEIKSLTIRAVQKTYVVHNLFHDLNLFDVPRLEQLRLDETVELLLCLPSLLVFADNLTDIRIESENTQIKIEDCYEIFKYPSTVLIGNLKLNYEQFQRMSAENIYVHIGEMTEKNIVAIVKKWQCGMLRRNVKSWFWSLKNSTFDLGKLSVLLGKDESNGSKTDHVIEVTSINDASSKATIEWYTYTDAKYLVFQPISNV